MFNARGYVSNPSTDFSGEGNIMVTFVNKLARSKGISEDFMVYTPALVKDIIKHMPNGKAGQCIAKNKVTGLLRGAISELFKMRADEICEELAVCSTDMTAERGIAIRMVILFFSAKLVKGDGADGENDYRTLNMLSHWGKSLGKQHFVAEVPKVAGAISYTQFGGLPRRGARDAIGIVLEGAMRLKDMLRASKSRNKPLTVLVQAFFDLSKAFDLLDRDDSREAMRSIVLSEGFILLLEAVHDGTCFCLKNAAAGAVVRRLLVPRGVRQGSVEGPTCFIILYDVSLKKISAARGQHLLFSHLDPIPLLFRSRRP